MTVIEPFDFLVLTEPETLHFSTSPGPTPTPSNVISSSEKVPCLTLSDWVFRLTLVGWGVL